MAELKQVDIDDLDVAIGTSVQLEFISPPGRHTVRVLGRIPGRSLIVSCPKVNGKNILVRDSQVVNVRLMLDTAVAAFSSKVAKSYLDPAGHLHIAKPAYVETSVVRQAVRVETRLICKLDPLPGDPKSILQAANGIVVDLSLGGCKVLSKEDFGSVNQVMKMAVNLTIGEYSHILKVDCEIRNQEIQMIEQVQATLADNAFLANLGVDYLYVYGIRFTESGKEMGIPLMAYILDTLKKKGK